MYPVMLVISTTFLLTIFNYAHVLVVGDCSVVKRACAALQRTQSRFSYPCQVACNCLQLHGVLMPLTFTGTCIHMYTHISVKKLCVHLCVHVSAATLGGQERLLAPVPLGF